MKFLPTFQRSASVHNQNVATKVQMAIQSPSAAEQPFHFRLEKQLDIWKQLSPYSNMELIENKQEEVVGFMRDDIVFIFKLSADKSAIKISTSGVRQNKRGTRRDHRGDFTQIKGFESVDLKISYTLAADLVDTANFLDFKYSLKEFMMVATLSKRNLMQLSASSLPLRQQPRFAKKCRGRVHPLWQAQS
jgi:hypothetical protein